MVAAFLWAVSFCAEFTCSELRWFRKLGQLLTSRPIICKTVYLRSMCPDSVLIILTPISSFVLRARENVAHHPCPLKHSACSGCAISVWGQGSTWITSVLGLVTKWFICSIFHMLWWSMVVWCMWRIKRDHKCYHSVSTDSSSVIRVFHIQGYEWKYSVILRVLMKCTPHTRGLDIPQMNFSAKNYKNASVWLKTLQYRG